MSLSAQDNQDGSGIKEVRYSATGADAIPQQTVAAANLPATFTIDAEGTTTISYFATDNAGNPESPVKTLIINIDKTPPTVGSTMPLNLATGVGRGISPTATFSEKMTVRTINTRTFKLFKVNRETRSTTQITDVEVSLSADGLTAKLNPFGTTTVLEPNTKYKAVVTTGAKDLAGNSLAQQKSWTFTTR